MVYAKEHPIQADSSADSFEILRLCEPVERPGAAGVFSGRGRYSDQGENDVIRSRYKMIRIGINSATVEDLQNHDQQTLPLVAEQNS